VNEISMTRGAPPRACSSYGSFLIFTSRNCTTIGGPA